MNNQKEIQQKNQKKPQQTVLAWVTNPGNVNNDREDRQYNDHTITTNTKKNMQNSSSVSESDDCLDNASCYLEEDIVDQATNLTTIESETEEIINTTLEENTKEPDTIITIITTKSNLDKPSTTASVLQTNSPKSEDLDDIDEDTTYGNGKDQSNSSIELIGPILDEQTIALTETM